RLDVEEEARYIADWKVLPIAAVKRGAVRVIHGSEVKSTGPRILALLDQGAAAIPDPPPQQRWPPPGSTMSPSKWAGASCSTTSRCASPSLTSSRSWVRTALGRPR